ncbi:hypothetical protein SS1G_00398 [Sclerotinia sclerotiorum 1980 UF-70]|uniref:Zn(2)-C6 fungal-type domain-containing protein n=2 Tax=Sclerotinia sclerotiorum (strain ATCC 18683 / 1980 / Ss-1) TaxID=665079 RepID=A0A1D9PZ50_SCLS1|nr:hypothetical protein SS1G_00398 [Sclerotinia sclerotiorum 1980 UF-70]APA07974.1 hypothetical protein sscle_03g027440 [Sclerotinia sclerotiorum 1980 UF-70]EDN90998.1 hypothetical protein SS1G_00398 [Sclerotinia sclerotiorum 1980 UF-70]
MDSTSVNLLRSAVNGEEDPNLSMGDVENSSGASNPQSPGAKSKKRKSSDGNGESTNPEKKKRSSIACTNCRSRKVRCDVERSERVNDAGERVCNNCAIDGIQCLVPGSKRRRTKRGSTDNVEAAPLQVYPDNLVNPQHISNDGLRPVSEASIANSPQHALPHSSQHVPHSIYQSALSRKENSDIDGQRLAQLASRASIHGDLVRTRLASSPPPSLKHSLPAYINPLPSKMTSVDIEYLWAKSALLIPEPSLRNSLLQSFIEFIYPYMPLLELHKVLQIINDEGASGSMSLLLFQSIMFSGTAFVDMDSLKRAGYRTRKAARKAFFQRARVLYDLDYENDMLTVVQSLLLMTYWYETPEDHKDTWHWMGRAIDHAYTLALHRDPKGMDADHKLRKRVWWSCFMRDRLIALGMRRPTRVKDEDCDVPMLTEDDFEIKALDPRNSIISSKCTLIRDVEAQRDLALMCISKAQLCLCISQVLVAQYSVLGRHQGVVNDAGSTTSQIMLFPKKSASTEEVEQCDLALDHWKENLPQACVYSNRMKDESSGRPLFVACSLLHMIYFTATSALHRPRVLPAGPNHSEPPTLFELSREVVTKAAVGTTNIIRDMHNFDLERYLPTTGVTALLPAIIIHLLLVRSPKENERQSALDGFCLCMTVLESLRDNYSSADYATQFLEAAVRKAGMEDIISRARETARREDAKRKAALAYEKQRAQLERMQGSMGERITPPVDTHLNGFESLGTLVDNSTAIYNGHLAHSPPDSDVLLGGTGSALPPDPNDMFEFLDINYNEGGESGGFYDMDLFSREIPGFGSTMPSPHMGGDNLTLFDQSYMNVMGM